MEQLTTTAAVVPGGTSGMRPPYGAVNRVVGETAEELGMHPIMWSGQAYDWRPPPVETIVRDIMAVTWPGAVILLHDGASNRAHTVAALKELLPYWAAQGDTLRAIPACTSRNPLQ